MSAEGHPEALSPAAGSPDRTAGESTVHPLLPLTANTHRTRPGSGSLAHVPALDGLRAVAVSMVIAYHLGITQMGGGFLGVDLFFVLSGFLITTLLLREFASDGRINLVGFWLRRARRLLPALFVLLAVTAVWASTTSPYDRVSLRWDILSALGYVANWRFIAAGQGYFQQFLTPSPVRHLWSLAIEEQFYIFWPLLTFAAFALARRNRVWGRRIVLTLLGAAIAASVLLLALMYNGSDPSTAYYATFTRAHELLIGAVAAVLVEGAPRLTAFLRRHAAVISTLGLAAIVAAGVFISDTDPFYYFGGSVAFSLSAAVLVSAVVAGAGSTGLVLRLLELRPIVWLGAVSYGAYLWHWPMIVWLTPETTGLDGPALAIARVGATLLVTTASFYVVERPIRRGTLGRIRLGARPVFAGAAVCVLVVGSLTVVMTRGGQALPLFLRSNRSLFVTNAAHSRGTIGLVGDSVTASLYPGFVYQGASRSLSVVAATFPGCSIGDTVRVDSSGHPFSNDTDCIQTTVRQQAAMVEQNNPSLIFWISARERYDILAGGKVLAGGSPGWEQAIFADWDRVLARLTKRGAHVVLVLPILGVAENPATCSAPEDLASETCTRPYLSDGGLRTEYLRWAATHQSEVTVIDPDPVLCPGGGQECPAEVSGIALRSDGVHFTQQGAIFAAAGLLSLLPPGLLP
jgi:peptidoglycan/LPS O-acetylase OafA/YrhL